MAQSADKAYAEPIHQRLFLYFDTSQLLAAFGLVDPLLPDPVSTE